MNSETAIAKLAGHLQRSTSKKYPDVPIALVTGPTLELSSGDPDQPFYTASVDKVFIATLIAQLFDGGHFSLDTPIGELLPEADVAVLPAAAGVENGRDVTVQHLLSHTAGLPDVLLPPRGFSTECSITEVEKAPERVWSVREMLHQVEQLPAFARPGEKFHYGDTAYFLLIRIIEEATGTSFGERLRTHVFEPAGMADTAEWVDADAEKLESLVPRLAPFWVGKPENDLRRAFAPNLTWSRGFGGPSTANDLVRFQTELHGDRLCDPEWVELMGAPRNRLRPGIHYGSGMVALKFGGFAPMLRGYPVPVGGLGFTATRMFYYPEQQTHVVLNLYSHRRMSASFQTHVRIAGLIKNHG